MAFDACLFDLYGTLLDLSGLRRAVPAGHAADTLIASWRAKQLEYSWTYSLMGGGATFEELAERALDWTLGRFGVQAPQARVSLLRAYRELGPHADAEPCLRQLRLLGVRCGVLSNGSERSIIEALDRSGLAPLLSDVLSVERVGVFKPHPRVYGFAADSFGVAPGAIAFQTANAWDAAGAAAAGLAVHWINRDAGPDEYRLRGSVVELRSLTELAPRMEVRG